MRSSLVVTDSRVWTAETEYALAVADAEAAMGASVTVAAPAGGPVAAEANGRFDFEALPGARPSHSPADFTADTRFVARMVRTRGFDVVHSSRPTSHIIAALSTGGRVPLVHLRGSAQAPSGGPVNRFLYNSATDAIIVSSSRIERWITERLRVPPERVVRLLAPVAPAWFEAGGKPEAGPSVHEELGLDAGRRLVLCVGRLAPIKGHDVLLGAMARVIAELPEAALALVGEAWSGQPEGLRRMAAELGIGRSVFFTGRRDDVMRFVAAADLCVSSSVGSEENSRAVSEYMAAGRPVVASRTGVIPELVADGSTGRLVEPGDSSAMAGAILSVLGDPEALRSMGEAGRREAELRLSPRAFAAELDSILNRVGAVT